MSLQPDLSPEATDRLISAAVRALAAGRGLKHTEVAEGIKMAQSTFERRLSGGGWTAVEVASLAALFEVSPEMLMTALDGTVAPPT